MAETIVIQCPKEEPHHKHFWQHPYSVDGHIVHEDAGCPGKAWESPSKLAEAAQEYAKVTVIIEKDDKVMVTSLNKVVDLHIQEKYEDRHTVDFSGLRYVNEAPRLELYRVDVRPLKDEDDKFFSQVIVNTPEIEDAYPNMVMDAIRKALNLGDDDVREPVPTGDDTPPA